MFKLVTGRLDQINQEFKELFQKLPEVVNGALSLSGCLDESRGLKGQDITHMRYIAIRLLLLRWAAFRRRVIRPLQQYPFKLFWLIKSHPKKFCEKRKIVAAEVLSLESHKLDVSTQKIKALCDKELRHMKEHGVFPEVPCASGSFLYAFLKGMARMPADTQAIEGINSVIKLVGRRCPNISLELLSSRLAVRRALSEAGSMRRAKKWSLIQKTAEGLLQSVLGYGTAALAIMSCPSRWSTPQPIDFGADSRQPPILAITDEQSIASACPGNMLIVPANADVGSHPPGLPGPASSSTAGAAGGDAAASAAASMLSPDAIKWAKSYNLAWRRSTIGSSSKKRNAMKDSSSGTQVSGVLLAIVQHDGLRGSRPHTSVYAVAETFSVSVMFSRIDVVDMAGQTCLQWKYDERNCIESTLFLMTFYAWCCVEKVSVHVGCVRLAPEKTVKLMCGQGKPENLLTLESVLAELKHCFVMSDLPMPGPQPKKTSKKKTAKAAARIKPKGKAKSSAGERVKRGRGGGHERDASDDGGEGVANFLEDDDQFIDDVDFQSASDADDSEADGLAADEIKQASAASAAASASTAKLPSADTVHIAASALQEHAELAPVGDLEEEALLLLVRQARSEDSKKLQVGCSRPASSKTDHWITGEGLLQSVSADTMPQDGANNRSAESNSESSEASEADSGGNDAATVDLSRLLKSLDMASLGRSGKTLIRWARSCHSSLRAMQDFARVKDLAPGYERSISLVLLKAQDPVPGCKCIRCKWKDTSHEVVWAHWSHADKLHVCIFSMRVC